jgi:hypothetical protein
MKEQFVIDDSEAIRRLRVGQEHPRTKYLIRAYLSSRTGAHVFQGRCVLRSVMRLVPCCWCRGCWVTHVALATSERRGPWVPGPDHKLAFTQTKNIPLTYSTSYIIVTRPLYKRKGARNLGDSYARDQYIEDGCLQQGRSYLYLKEQQDSEIKHMLRTHLQHLLHLD